MKDKMIPMAIVAFGAGYLLFEFGRVTGTPKVRPVAHIRRGRGGTESFGMHPPVYAHRPGGESNTGSGIPRPDGGEVAKQPETTLAPRVRTQLARPPRYDVIGFNSGKTPDEFIARMIETYLQSNFKAAVVIATEVKNEGEAVLTTRPLPKDVAEIVSGRMTVAARNAGHPFVAGIRKH